MNSCEGNKPQKLLKLTLVRLINTRASGDSEAFVELYMLTDSNPEYPRIFNPTYAELTLSQ